MHIDKCHNNYHKTFHYYRLILTIYAKYATHMELESGDKELSIVELSEHELIIKENKLSTS